jgi:hypothetical protein
MRIFLAGEDHVLAILRRKKMRVHLADTPPWARLRLSMMAGHPYRLVSYFYIKDDKNAGAVLRELADRPEDMIVDSGLFSYMFGSEQGTIPETYEAYRDYTRRYLDDLARWNYEGLVVESDAQRLLGMEAVHKLRDEFAPLGDRVMYVWHEPEGLDGLEVLAREKSYIAFGLPELRHIAETKAKKKGGKNKVSKQMVMNLMRRVHKACGESPPRIHLLGCTVEDLMETSLAWSCDSTSWLAGIRFGQAFIFIPGKGTIEQCHVSSERFRAYRNDAVKKFPDVVAFASQQKNPEYYLNCFGCAHAFAQYQRWLDGRYQNVPMRGDELPGGACPE